jgi:hypothetical protein
MVRLVSLLPCARAPRGPAPQAVRLAPWIQLINVRIREDGPAASPHVALPAEADGRQRHPARVRIPAVGQGKGKNVVSHQPQRNCAPNAALLWVVGSSALPLFKSIRSMFSYPL